MTGGCFGPVLVRFLSIRRPAAAERDLHTEDGGAGEWSRRMTRESRRWERERDPRDEKGEYRRERRSGITQDGTTAGMLRERNKEEEREKRGEWRKERKRERRQPRR